MCLEMNYNFAAITCSPIADPINGTVFHFATVDDVGNYVFKATYSCNSGFALMGNQTRNCSGDGNSTTGYYDGMAPTCKGKYSFCTVLAA